MRATTVFADPELQNELKLTDAQKETIKTIYDEWQGRFGEIVRENRGNAKAMGAKTAALGKETVERIVAELNPEQIEFKPNPRQGN
jgi:hypothetical protein